MRLIVPSDGRQLSLHMRGVACGVSIAMKGERTTRRITHGNEVKWAEGAGMVSFVPPDGEPHTYSMNSHGGCELFAVLIPQGHLKEIAACEGILPLSDWAPVLASNDPVVHDCMARLASAPHGNDAAVDVGLDEIARRLTLRITAINGGGAPDWCDDGSVFDRRMLHGLVAYLDEHLRVPPSLSCMSARAGMSPSHFARKFRLSTGLSLYRFINRRRILRSLETLRADSSLASCALDLGFCSQSHFTRLFSDLTGVTPAKYQKHFKRMVG
jgi:AraC-like DNA-binding protein